MSNDETVAPPPTSPSVGSQLKVAREGKRLEVADIAKAQHLRPAIIQAIEDGDFGEIGSELFLKGYVRTYASQVGLNAEELIAQLDRELEPLRQEREQQRQNHPLVTIEERKQRKQRVAKGLLFLVFVLVAVFIGYKLFIQDITGTGGLTASRDEAGQSESSPATGSGGVAEAQVPLAEQIPALPREAADASELAEPSAEPVVEPMGTEPVAPVPVTGDASTTEPAPGSEAGPSTAETVEPATAVGESQPVAQPVADAGEARLLVTFTADCWVQVTDADGRRLASRLRRSGDQLDVSGTPPLQVVIGAVDAVSSISFQGQPVDLSGFRVVNNRAEFTLGN
ncbi:MAG: DUF4115 domain-containing protein [Marinobacter sp.]|uniref:RodZ domain-containing protein n=1 Tax=Marinobacter sp. TaxID=50741 RepID=UPI00299F3BD2|nr:RodZ domain-containing protein [Marinobacter sp.]MDX1757296.1 DUF4115 domain-containing protein [Marinobacter sp.]